MSDLKNLNLNVEEESKNAGFDALPAGEYVVVITAAELKTNANNAGEHVSITAQVIEGDFENRLLFHNFNVQNANPTAEKIGRGELSCLCKALGITAPTDTDELKDIPFRVKVAIDRKDPTRNQMKAFLSADAATTAAVEEKKEVEKPAAKPAPAAPKTGLKPWQTKK